MKDLFGSEVIRTLGLYQPFATLMLHDKIETRWVEKKRKPPFPFGKYLIYSCKLGYDMNQLDSLCGKYTEIVQEIIDANKESNHFWSVGQVGFIGDLVKIIDPLVMPFSHFTYIDDGKDELIVERRKRHGRMVTVGYRRVGLIFENIQALEPFAFTGKQGIGFYKGDRSLIKPIAE